MKQTPAQAKHPLRAQRALMLVFLGALLLSELGCSPPQAKKTYEFVTNYKRMLGRDPLVSLLYLPEVQVLAAADGIVIGDWTVGGVEVEGKEVAGYYANLFRIMLSNELKELTGPEHVERVFLAAPPGAEDRREPGLLLVEGQVTVFDMGNPYLRYFGGFLFLGLGASDLQLEGRVTDYATGSLVMEFVDRRRHLANTPFGPNMKNLTDHTFAMKITLLHTARSLAYLLAKPEEALAVVETGKMPDDALDASEED